MAGEQKPDLDALVGRCLYLAYHSPLHRRYTIDAFNACFLPGIQLNQFRYYEREGRPMGFATWAWLTDDAAGRYQGGDYIPEPEEWNKGPNLWFIEFLSPFGGARHMVSDMSRGLLSKHIGHGIRRRKDGTIRCVQRYIGRDA